MLLCEKLSASYLGTVTPSLPKFVYAWHFPHSVLFHRTHYNQFIDILLVLSILLNAIHHMWHLIVIRYDTRPLSSPILLTLVRQI